jgi:hypothetical protein
LDEVAKTRNCPRNAAHLQPLRLSRAKTPPNLTIGAGAEYRRKLAKTAPALSNFFISVEITQARNSFRYTPPSAIAVSDGARQNPARET